MLRRELNTGRERLESSTADVARLGRELGAVREDAAEAAEAAGRLAQERLAGVDATFTLMRADLGANREQLEALEGGVERLSVQVAAGPHAESEARAAEVLTELAAVRELAEQAGAGVARAARAELAAMREETAAVSVAGRAGQRGRREGPHHAPSRPSSRTRRSRRCRPRSSSRISTMEEMKAGLTSAGQAALVARREAEQAKKAAEHAGDGTRRARQRRASARSSGSPPRAVRAGSTRRLRTALRSRASRATASTTRAAPMAVIGIDGKFKELNPSFCRLVGYQEHEFAKAAWPSPHDRQLYAQQQEQFSELVSGVLETVPVQSTYMHGQGLMVPVVGEITAVKGEDGLTSHLLLRAEERERTL